MAEALDLAAILKMFQAGPTPEERQTAGAHAMARTGLGILSGNRSGPVLQVGRPSLLGILGQGGLQGMDAYQGALNQGMAERKAGGLAALQAMQIKKQMDQQRALQGLLSPQEPAGATPAPQAVGLSPQSADAVGAPWAAAAPVPQSQAPAPGGFQPIPADRLAAAAAAGVNIDPLLRLNAEARPDVIHVDAGNTIRLIDKKTLKVLGEIPKGAAPGSRPFEASDIGPSSYRDFLLSKTKAGKTDVNVKVDTKLGEGIAKEIGPMLAESRSAAMGALDAVDTAHRISEALATGKLNIGPGAQLRTAVDQVAQILGAGGADTAERLVNTRNVGRGLAQFTIAARKALKGQGQVSDFEGKLLQRAESGDINDFTVPELKSFVALTERLARKQYENHARNIANMSADPNLKSMVPFYAVPEMPSPQGEISPRLRNLLDRFAPQ